MPTPALPLSGLETLLTATPKGIGRLLGMQFDTVEEGTVTFSLTTRPEFVNVSGQVHGGIYATLLDSVMGCAVHSTLEPGIGYTTLEMKINLTRAVSAERAKLVATGRTLHVGGRTATAEGEIRDEMGRLVAHGTTTCLILR
ncbi:putative esterase [Nocardia cerradoensis]|uniref:Putative esterase n=1 Tax=Nocardia cerradoensis TaxID=85688 RepID=A0A231H4B4_9NOCA|nr:putative esterase [Nocardia cerradoensis]